MTGSDRKAFIRHSPGDTEENQRSWYLLVTEQVTFRTRCEGLCDNRGSILK